MGNSIGWWAEAYHQLTCYSVWLMSIPKADGSGLKLIYSRPSEMMPICLNRRGGGGSVRRGLPWMVQSQQYQCCRGSADGRKGDAIYNFLPRRERGHSPGWGNPSLAYIPRALKQWVNTPAWPRSKSTQIRHKNIWRAGYIHFQQINVSISCIHVSIQRNIHSSYCIYSFYY